MQRNFFTAILLGLVVTFASAFVVPSAQTSRPALVRLDASNKSVEPKNFLGVAAAAIMTSAAPAAVWAAENAPDDYEYGAVDAPISIAWVVGVLAILTALLPVALKGGEEAFEEMKDRDSDQWGSGTSDVLNKNRRK